MNTPYIVLDCETSALPEAERNLFRPSFEAPANYVDKAKIDAAIAKKEAEWAESAALSSLTGKILCVGCWTEKKGVHVLEAEDEGDVIQSAFDLIQHTLQSGGKVIGHAIKTFDLPFLMQRAYRYGIHVPQCYSEGRWWNPDIIDLMEVWSGPASRDRISLDHLAKALGVGTKNGEGKEFGTLWATDKPKALSYVRNDILLIKGCADKMLSQ